jgi:hypothetical protein
VEEGALMFFLLSKTVAFLLLPSNFLILLGLLGVILMAARRRRAGLSLVLTSIVLLAIAGWWPTGSFLTHSLESRFPPWKATRTPDGIVVLGGAIKSRLSHEFGRAVLGDEADRIVAVAKLARAYPATRIFYSGGDASLRGNQSPEVNFVAPLLEGLGIPSDRVELEPRAQYGRKRCLHERTCKTEAGGTVASGHLGAAHAACNRLLQAHRFSGGSLSSRLAHRP